MSTLKDSAFTISAVTRRDASIPRGTRSGSATSPSDANLAAELERVSLAEATPQEAVAALIALHRREPAGFAQRAYVTLKAATLRMLTGRRSGELAEWADVIRQASALAKRLDREGLGERLLALGDLVVDWLRLVEAHPIGAVLERPHVRDILEVLRKHGGRAERTVIQAKTGIGEANLSRIFGSLEAVGLIERDRRRRRTVTLTAEAERRLAPASSGPAASWPAGFVEADAVEPDADETSTQAAFRRVRNVLGHPAAQALAAAHPLASVLRDVAAIPHAAIGELLAHASPAALGSGAAEAKPAGKPAATTRKAHSAE